ncbi:MaoC family dehydratase [Aciditerrimonas ferrireducens]|jgi:acyl dehydratase|uniref:MaoC family dehydratase n=1 Tax=Aciditerrimonas ferrireducens TaxID=667306 RepID=A0ABV6C2K7_9ACTN|nr:MaoC family dehydratase [Aciditerrimonas ferrireducens]MCK4176945.1 MaoC family dehydratase [Aciditerrimonas ferrireducens]
MSSNAERAYEALLARKGEEEGVGEWFLVDQDLVNAFADVTRDHQFIHVDPEKAAQLTPWGGTIAHGFLTLSLLTHLSSSIRQSLPPLDGLAMGINYGFDRVRFLTPVKVGSRIRARSALRDVALKPPSSVDLTRAMTVEIEGEEKPALVADWITRLVFA